MTATKAVAVPGGPRGTHRWASVLGVLARRAGTALLTVWISSVVVFLAVEVLPQDPARVALGLDSTEAQRAAFREQLGLDDPAVVRYARWLGDVLQGDFGTSIVSRAPIAPELWTRLQNTALLAVLAVLISVVIGIPLAMRAARRPGGAFDAGANLASVTISAVPEFVAGMLLSYLLASWLGWLPVLSSGLAQGSGLRWCCPH